MKRDGVRAMMYWFGGFTFTLVWVSFRFFKRFGISTILLYAVFSTVALYFLIVRFRQSLLRFITPKYASLIVFLMGVLLLAGSLKMNSLINSNYFTDANINYGNTDVDDAITLALSTFLKGEYPYTPKTWAGCLISPMPGALLLALPFHILGNAAAQVPFWVCALFFAGLYLMRDGRSALWFWLLALLFSPKIIEDQMFQGSDHLANATYVALSALLLVEVSKKSARHLPGIMCALLLGVTMSSRMNFLILLPLIFSALVHASGWRKAIILMFFSFCSFTAVTAPFYFYAPQHFSPLHIISTIENAPTTIRFFNSFSLLLVGTLSIVLAIKSNNANLLSLLRNCFLLQLCLVLSQLFFVGITTGDPKRIWMYVQYGYFFYPFGFLYFGTGLHRFLGKRAASKTAFLLDSP